MNINQYDRAIKICNDIIWNGSFVNRHTANSIASQICFAIDQDIVSPNQKLDRDIFRLVANVDYKVINDSYKILEKKGYWTCYI
ncbi:hypothetical protein SAMN05443550_1171 [Pedobacter hartonius]|uniref:Uncharacterized protein n=1 Tax=Pedobacter hartonius TaxID=425514 RepID=A0A1H4HFD4_9SPHI|nr:hypothetical protein SAMN05443550_1171 [Pedobacter hartonius]